MDTTESTPMLQTEAGCTTCAKHMAEQEESNETSTAFLLALVPVMVLTFFGQVGLL